PYGGTTSGTTASSAAIGAATRIALEDERARGCRRTRVGALSGSGVREASTNRGWPEPGARRSFGSGVREASTNRGWPEPGARRSLPSEEAGGPREQHGRRREVEDRQLDLREPRDPGLPDEPDDDGADERALEAPEPADDDDDEREE